MNATRVVPSTPIARSASTEHSRYAIAGVQPVVSPHAADDTQIVAGFLVATNGRMLAVAPATFYDPPAKKALPIIPIAAIPANVTGITINGKIESSGGTRKKPLTTLHEPVEGTFPPAGAVAEGVVDEHTQWIGLSAKLLLDLAASLGSGEMSHVYLGIKVKMLPPPNPLSDDPPADPPPPPVPTLIVNRAIAVVPGGDGLHTDAFGVLMPVSVQNDSEGMTARFNRSREVFIQAWDRHEALVAGREPAPYIEPEPTPPPKITMKPVFGTPSTAVKGTEGIDRAIMAGGVPEIQAPRPPRAEGGSPDAAIALAKKLGIEVVTVTG